MMKNSKSKDLDAEYSCKVRLLDDAEISCDFKVNFGNNSKPNIIIVSVNSSELNMTILIPLSFILIDI